MNYYIKGEHPTKWVIEKLHEHGVSEKNLPISTNGTCKAFYCIVGDDYEYICSDAIQAAIEASPDWEEIKPAEPEFKVGDIVMYHGGFFQVTEVKEGDGVFIYSIGDVWCYFEDLLTRPDNPTVRHKVKEAFAILHTMQEKN